MRESGGKQKSDRKGSGRMMLASYIERTGDSAPVLDCFGGRYVSDGWLGVTELPRQSDPFEEDDIRREAESLAALTDQVEEKRPAA